MSERIVVAMSGGVDSSVAAALLKEQGYDVVGLFMRTGIHYDDEEVVRRKACCSLEDAQDARRVAAILDIPYYAIDYEREFDRIIDYFVSEYQAGRTPNPCARCNQWLKFGALLDFAEGIGATRVATGHYARVREGEDGRMRLERGVDDRKDQTYFLFPLRQEQLRRILFPLCDLPKDEVRKLAAKHELPVTHKRESQEICFVPSNDYRELLEERVPESLRTGELVDTEGKVLGTHEGYQRFTIGQRRGLGIALGHPAYVVDIDPKRNRVVVGTNEDLVHYGLTAGEMNWIAGEAPSGEFVCQAQIRHNHTPAPARAEARGDGICHVWFDEPERAVTPGQALVLYDGKTVIGGGWIREAKTKPR